MTRKSFNIDTDTFIKGILLFILTAVYVLTLYTLVVAVAILPFTDPYEMEPAAWLLPFAGHAALLDAFITIVFGPHIGIMVLATVIVLLTTPRVYRWLRIGINDLIDGQHDDAYTLIANVHPHLETMRTPQTILPTITATIAQTLKLPFVKIEANGNAEPPAGALVATFGTPPIGTDIEQIPLLYQGAPIGDLRVSARRASEPLSRSDLQVLGDLARQVSIALYAAQLTADLQQSRTRLVTAREEERRRIRRDLHDGLGPTLANIAMQLEQAREQLPPDAAASDAILGNLTTETQTAIASIRRLVYDLRPPDLDEYGLVSSLREYLHRMQPKAMTLALDAPEPLPPLPAAVEVAAYRIVQEAVNNALKYANATVITVTLAMPQAEEAPVSLRVEICDNGVGLPADHPIGIGLHSMRERAEELGGSCLIGTGDAGGTIIAAQLPIG